MKPTIFCIPKSLPPSLHEAARRRAIEINPANAVQHRAVFRTKPGVPGAKARLAIVIGRRWPTKGVRLTVSFLDNAPADLRTRILLHMNAWTKTANVHFTQVKRDGQVRITRVDSPPDDSGYWSYIGTDIEHISMHKATMNLEGFTMDTPESEFHRVVRHETGHTMGFEHEHMRAQLVKRIDPKKAYAYFKKYDGWSKSEVDDQVLTPLDEKTLMGTTQADPHSIMCYQLPGSIMKDGKAIAGGLDIDKKDFAFAASMYPKKLKMQL